jgi:hypothetical protein
VATGTTSTRISYIQLIREEHVMRVRKLIVATIVGVAAVFALATPAAAAVRPDQGLCGIFVNCFDR